MYYIWKWSMYTTLQHLFELVKIFVQMIDNPLFGPRHSSKQCFSRSQASSRSDRSRRRWAGPLRVCSNTWSSCDKGLWSTKTVAVVCGVEIFHSCLRGTTCWNFQAPAPTSSPRTALVHNLWIFPKLLPRTTTRLHNNCTCSITMQFYTFFILSNEIIVLQVMLIELFSPKV